MKKVIALLIVLCLFVPCAFAGESIVSETQLSPRLIEGNYHWIFDVTFTNDTEQPLTVVSVESLDRFAEGDVCSWHKTGTQLVEERYAEKALRILFLYLVIFSAVHTVLTAVTGVEQTTLIEQTFVVFGVEAGGLLLKRIVDKIFGRKNDDV